MLPRPARPATCVSSWNVRSAARKSGRPSAVIGSDDSDQRHAVNVVALGDHLRAHQHVEFAFVERVQGTLEVFATANGVAIEATDARLREHAVQQFFQLLRSGADEIHVLAAAVRAFLWHWRDEAAVVAFHLVLAFVMRHARWRNSCTAASCRRCGRARPASTRGG